MTTDTQNEELEQAIAEAELTETEATEARELHEAGGQVASIIPFLLQARETPPETEEQPVPQPPAGAAEPTKKQLDALDNEQIRHLKRVREVMGDFVAGFVECDKCGSVGIVAPGEPPPEPQEHEWFKACTTCAGFGQVLTGSHRAGQEARDCPACKGRGYLEAMRDGQPLADGATAPAVEPIVPELTPTPQPVSTEPGKVTFGTPAWMGDPNLSA